MTYQSAEQSEQDGAIIELYRFVIGVETVRYTSSASPVIYQGETYTPSSATRDKMKQTQDINRDGIGLQFPRENPFARRILAHPPDQVVTLTVYRRHFGDNDTVTAFKGRVVGARATNNSIMLDIESVYTSVRRAGLRATYQTLCRHALYSPGCGLSRASWGEQGIVQSISGLVVTTNIAAQKPDGYYLAGILQSGIYQRQITKHVGNDLTITEPIPGLVGNADIEIFPGCNLTYDTCHNKFNNSENFGGFTQIPGKNPFDTTLF